MEAVVLQVLEWRMLTVTASDFVANMLAHLPRCGVPLHLLKNAEQRADELIQGILAGALNLTQHILHNLYTFLHVKQSQQRQNYPEYEYQISTNRKLSRIESTPRGLRKMM